MHRRIALIVRVLNEYIMYTFIELAVQLYIYECTINTFFYDDRGIFFIKYHDIRSSWQSETIAHINSDK